MLAQVVEGTPIHKEPVEKLVEPRWATGLTWFLPHGLLMLGRHEPLAKRDTSTQLAAMHGVSVPCRSLECVCVCLIFAGTHFGSGFEGRPKGKPPFLLPIFTPSAPWVSRRPRCPWTAPGPELPAHAAGPAACKCALP